MASEPYSGITAGHDIDALDEVGQTRVDVGRSGIAGTPTDDDR
jgi:hypothetical protein